MKILSYFMFCFWSITIMYSPFCDAVPDIGLNCVPKTDQYAQSIDCYDSIMLESKQWSTLSGGYGTKMLECCHTTHFIKIETDPSINTIDEKKVLISSDSLRTWTRIGHIRERDKKIYFRDLNNHQGLLYDFSASVGDTLKIVNYAQQISPDTLTIRVEHIDTLEYFGITRPRFEVKNIMSGQNDFWVSGIGSLKGLLNPCLELCGGFRELLCVHNDGVQIYQNPNRLTCYMDSNTIRVPDFEGLWKMIANVYDGSTERYDNIYFDVEADELDFLIAGTIVGKGKISHDSIYVLSGFEPAVFDWIVKVNEDSLISSRTNSKHVNTFSFSRIDLTGNWEQLNYWWNGRIDRDSLAIVQQEDSIFFYSSRNKIAQACLKKDSLLVLHGFEGIGIDFFTLHSNHFFSKMAPLAESIDKVYFVRLGQQVRLEKVPETVMIQVFPNPANESIHILSTDQLIRRIHLYSTSGALLKSCKPNSLSWYLPTADLKRGIYLLEIVFRNGDVFVQKIAKD